MMRVLVAMAAMAIAAGADAAPTVRTSLDPSQGGWFVCDAVNGPQAAFVSTPDERRQSLVMLLDRRTGKSTTTAYVVSDGDAGAGSQFWMLTRDGKEAGAIRIVNPQMVDGGDRYLPPVKQLRLGATSLDCRWIAHMRFLGLDAKRSVTVSEEAGGLVYRSYDFATRGSITQPDGVQVTTPPTATAAGGLDDGRVYRFDKNGFSYVIARPGIPILSVLKDGTTVQTEPLVMAAWVTPPRATNAAVWDGTGLDRCRTIRVEAGQCLLDAMRSANASPAAIAFAERIRARGDAGYVSAWRQAGPIGVATVTYPFRANTNEGTVLVPAASSPIFVDDYRLGAQAMARPDYQALVARAPGAMPFAPATISGARPAPGAPVTIRARTPMATCHACAPVGSMVVDYAFTPSGRLLGTRLVAVG